MQQAVIAGAASYVADMIIRLNLTEQGDPSEEKERGRRKDEIHRRRDLPLCLSTSRNRE